MHPSALSRSVTATAALALSAGLLAATPAEAATPSGITRDMVLTAVNGLRASYSSGDDPSPATINAVRSIINRACPVDADAGEAADQLNAIPTKAGGSAEGIIVLARIGNFETSVQKNCLAGVVASVDPARTLSGSMTIIAKTTPGNRTRTVSAPLAGDVTAAPSIVTAEGTSFSDIPTFTASGAANRTVTIPAKTVKDVKTKAERKRAAARYAKKLTSIEKSYAKARKKAGSSASKKAAAKRTFVARKKAAKAAYRYAIADYRIVKKARRTTDSQPFDLSLLLL